MAVNQNFFEYSNIIFSKFVPLDDFDFSEDSIHICRKYRLCFIFPQSVVCVRDRVRKDDVLYGQSRELVSKAKTNLRTKTISQGNALAIVSKALFYMPSRHLTSETERSPGKPYSDVWQKHSNLRSTPTRSTL